MDKELLKLEDKKFVANKADRGQNTSKILSKLDELKPKPLPDVLKVELEGAEIVTIKGAKGDKGEKPSDDELLNLIIPLIPEPIPGQPGADGDDYTLTAKDKKEIASKIQVPVVEKIIEKIEIIREQPIVKEVAVKDNAEQIVKKLTEFKKAWIELSQIKGLQELLNENGRNFLQQAKAFAPRTLDSLYDVQVRGTIQDGQSLIYNAAKQKWLPGTGAGSGSLAVETPSGAINGVNTTFTVFNTPVFITLNGQVLTGSGVDYTYSAGTITTILTPQVGDILRSYHN